MTSDGEVVLPNLLDLDCPPEARTEVDRLNLVINSSKGSKLFSELEADLSISAPVRITSAGREVLVDGEGDPETECLMLLVGGTVSI